MTSPLVSICIPAYNDAKVVGDALRSAIGQSHAPLEILVLDNDSSDGTDRIVARVSGGDPRVRYIRQPKNIGMAGNFNACISLAKGEYVQILCADDALEADCASSLAKALQGSPGAVLAACGRIRVDESMRPIGILRARRSPEIVAPDALFRECFVRGNRIGEPSAVMFRRAAAGRGFNEKYSQALDLEMWFHLLGQGAAVLLPDALCRIRRHVGQTTQQNIRSGRVVEDKRSLFVDYASRLTAELSVLEKLQWDARMASSIVRSTRCGREIRKADIAEVFYRGIFRTAMVPAVCLGWSLRSGK